MPRKVIAKVSKERALERVRGGEAAADVARRYNVDPQTVRWWVREAKRRNPEAWAKVETNRTQEDVVVSAREGGDSQAGVVSGGDPSSSAQPPLHGAGAVEAALQAAGVPVSDGKKPDAVHGEGKSQPPPVAPGANRGEFANAKAVQEVSDEQLVFMACGRVLGLAMRAALFFHGFVRHGVTVEVTPELAKLFTLTEGERVELKECAPTLAPKIRKWIGSNEEVAMAASGMTLVGGLFDRFSAVKIAVDRELAKRPPKREEVKTVVAEVVS